MSTAAARPTTAAAAGRLLSLPALGNFGVAKLAIYLAPVALAAVAPPHLYGAIEIGFAVALAAVTLLVAAPMHGMTHLYLVGRSPPPSDQAAAAVAGVSGASLTLAAAAWLTGASLPVLLAAAMLGPVSLQLAGAYLLRAYERPLAMAWVDGAVLFAVSAVVAASLWLLPPGRAGATVALSLAAVSAAALAGSLGAVLGAASGLAARLGRSLRLGAPMAAYDLLNTWAAVSGRVLIGMLAPADLPAYGVAFRLTGAAVGLYRIATTLLWAPLYRSRTRAADRLLARFMAANAALAALVALAGPLSLGAVDLRAIPGEAARETARILPVVALQLFFAGGHAMLQPRVNRTGTARGSLRLMAAIAVAAAAAVAGAHRAGGGLEAMCWLLAAGSAAFFFGTLGVLARRGLPHRRTLAAGAAGGLLLLLPALWAVA